MGRAAVQVDARVFSVIDRSHLVGRGVLPYVELGATRAVSARWALGAEVLHVPLDVRREVDGEVENDAYTALRLRLEWRARQ